MKPITDPTLVERYQKLVREMTISEENKEYEFDFEWVRNHAWKVVPVEDGNHFTPGDIRVIVPALRDAGYADCIAVATEPVGSLPAIYRLSVTEEDFMNFNSECGLLRYLLTDENRSWAISCNELYVLFAGKKDLLEAVLGKSIEQARRDYIRFATAISKKADEPLLKVAERYCFGGLGTDPK
jgi:hypothetical protein